MAFLTVDPRGNRKSSTGMGSFAGVRPPPRLESAVPPQNAACEHRGGGPRKPKLRYKTLSTRLCSAWVQETLTTPCWRDTPANRKRCIVLLCRVYYFSLLGAK